MKHIKRFNEEVSPKVYKSAANKLRKLMTEKPTLAKAIGAEERAKNLEDHAQKLESNKRLEKWNKNVEKFKKYGEFNFELEVSSYRNGQVFERGFKTVQPFYLNLELDAFITEENIIDTDENNRSYPIVFLGGLIPATEEFAKTALEIQEGNLFSDGIIWSFILGIYYEIEDGQVFYKGISISDYDNPVLNVQIADRKTAVLLKKLLCNIFDEKFDYPSGYSDSPVAFDKIETDIIQDLELSANWAIDMGRIKEDLQKTPIISFYKQ